MLIQVQYESIINNLLCNLTWKYALKGWYLAKGFFFNFKYKIVDKCFHSHFILLLFLFTLTTLLSPKHPLHSMKSAVIQGKQCKGRRCLNTWMLHEQFCSGVGCLPLGLVYLASNQKKYRIYTENITCFLLRINHCLHNGGNLFRCIHVVLHFNRWIFLNY